MNLSVRGFGTVENLSGNYSNLPVLTAFLPSLQINPTDSFTFLEELCCSTVAQFRCENTVVQRDGVVLILKVMLRMF